MALRSQCIDRVRGQQAGHVSSDFMPTPVDQDRSLATETGEKERARLLCTDDGEWRPSQHDAGVEDIVSLKQTADRRLGEPIAFLCLSAPDRRVASLIA